jgi:hypothetical protein
LPGVAPFTSIVRKYPSLKYCFINDAFSSLVLPLKLIFPAYLNSGTILLIAEYCKFPPESNPPFLFNSSTNVPGLKLFIEVLMPDFSIKIDIDVTKHPISPIVLLVLPILIFDHGSPALYVCYE